MKKLIILDRDGVINFDSPDYIRSPAEWIPIPGSLAAIAQLQQHGYLVAVASNQSGLGRGYFSAATLEEIHAKLQQDLMKHGGQFLPIFYCSHHPDANCSCRKPKTGLLEQIQKYFNLPDLKTAISIGDSYRDYQAAESAGCAQFILVKTGNGKKFLEQHPNLAEIILVAENLFDAVQKLDALHSAPEL